MRPMVLNLIFAVAGLVVGGLINLLADDLPARVKPSTPHCLNCGNRFGLSRWLGLGRMLQGGRCPQCEEALGRRYVAVELIMALIYALLPSLISRPVDLFFAA